MSLCKDLRYLLHMDAILSEKKVSTELIRESLMAISQCVPDVITTEGSFVKTANAPVADQDGDGTAEEYRSKLISITNLQSPNAQPSPTSMDNLGA
ncbi:hypothetical protein C4D60_Mb11t07170 [Musa balbisiana]|uniref:Uncharacterized protein n=1 Tax=Musa balbisiana TaxID=52838 RepID=A0A4S8J2H2_MUSBA|nr:hypothetical protein C4D60_Mb11t07170 [Musa balbisiana]